MSPRENRLLNSVFAFIIASLVLLGIVMVVSFGYQQYLIVKLLTVSLLIPLFFYLSVQQPELVLAFCLMLYFTPISENYGNILFAGFSVVAISLKAKRVLVDISRDVVVLSWLGIMGCMVLTIGRWSNLLTATIGFHHFILIPLFTYIIISKDIISEQGCRRLYKFYLPVIIFYASVQVAIALMFDVSYSEINVMSTHTGIDLGWGFSNTLAAIMVLFASILIGNQDIRHGNPFVRLLYIVLGTFSIATAFIIVSRGAMLSLFLGMLLFVAGRSVLKRNIDIWRWTLSIGAGCCLLGVVFYKYLLALSERFVHMRVEFSFLSRLYLIRDSVLTMRRNLFIGAGPNQYHYREFFRYLEDPHNIFLRYGVDFGVASVVLIIVILLVPVIRLFKLSRLNPDRADYIYGLLMLPFIVAIINSQFEAAIVKYQYGLVFWILYSLAIRSIRTAGETNRVLI